MSVGGAGCGCPAGISFIATLSCPALPPHLPCRDILQCCPKLLHLDVSGCSKLTDGAAYFIGTLCGPLRQRGLRDVHCLTDSGVDYLARHCPRLQELVLDG